MPAVGVILILWGLLCIIYYKQGGELFADFQKGWGLKGKNAIVFGRFLGLFGGFLALALGIIALFR